VAEVHLLGCGNQAGQGQQSPHSAALATRTPSSARPLHYSS
jgi:hypothetical protein